MAVDDVESIEAAEHAAEDISKEERRGSLKLWFAVLGSPMAWAGHLGGNYSLEEWFACSTAAHVKGEIVGVGVHTVAILLNSAMAAIALLSGLVALQCWRKLRGQAEAGNDDKPTDGGDGEHATEDVDDSADRARWMAGAGIVEGALFLGIILLGYLPALTIGACETTP